MDGTAKGDHLSTAFWGRPSGPEAVGRRQKQAFTLAGQPEGVNAGKRNIEIRNWKMENSSAVAAALKQERVRGRKSFRGAAALKLTRSY